MGFGPRSLALGEPHALRSTKKLSGQKRLIFTVRGKTGDPQVVCNQTIEDLLKPLLETSDKSTVRMTENRSFLADLTIFRLFFALFFESFLK